MNCKKEFQKNDIIQIIGEEKYNALLKGTCGVCGKIDIENSKNFQELACNHSICNDCFKNKRINASAEEKIKFAYKCRICACPIQIISLGVCGNSHKMKIEEIFREIYKNDNFNLDIDPDNIKFSIFVAF